MRYLCTGCFRHLPRFLFKTVPDGFHKAGTPVTTCRVCLTKTTVRFRPYHTDAGVRKLEQIELTPWQRIKDFFAL